jgi:hypothetical protein
MTCYLAVRTRNGQQESYESASRDAGRRVRQLRKLGYKAYSSPLGPQVTRVGIIRLTLVTVELPTLWHHDNLPAPDKMERL